jgi:signal transduction histidine kinase
MSEKPWASFILALLVGTACLLLDGGLVVQARLIICILLLACLLVVRLLLQLGQAPRAAVVAVTLVLVGLGWWTLEGFMLAFVGILVCALCHDLLGGYRSLVAAACIVIIGWAVFPQQAEAVLFTVVAVGAQCLLLLLCDRLEHSRALAQAHDLRVHELEQLLEGQRQMIQAIQRDAQLEERNRIAARIHDQLGHGVSGSVLTLEAALVNWEGDPGAARAGVVRATQSLRASVDAIRFDLRGERAGQEQAGLTRIASQLHAFEEQHGVTAHLEVEGSLEAVPPAVWVCVYQNLLETLTNLLKHSQATCFTLSLACHGGILEVEGADNGGTFATPASAGLAHGMGLCNIEERCQLCGGVATFKQPVDGFHTLMVFTLKGF